MEMSPKQKPNHICHVCGTPYYACNSCLRAKKMALYREFCCSPQCWQVFIAEREAKDQSSASVQVRVFNNVSCGRAYGSPALFEFNVGDDAMEKNRIIIRSKVTGELYDDAEVVHVWNATQAYKYMTNGAKIIDIFPGHDRDGNERFCFVFTKEHDKMLYPLWQKHKL